MRTNLLNSHDYLYCIETIETKIVVEVRFGVELANDKYGMHQVIDEVLHTFEVSWTCFQISSCSTILELHPYLVEVLKEIHYPASDLVLRKTGARGIASDGLEVCGGSDLLGLEERASHNRASHCGLASWCSAGS